MIFRAREELAYGAPPRWRVETERGLVIALIPSDVADAHKWAERIAEALNRPRPDGDGPFGEHGHWSPQTAAECDCI